MKRTGIVLATAAVIAGLTLGCGGKGAVPEVNKGVQMFEARDYDGAHAYYEDVLAKTPGDVEATYYLGRIAIAQEQHDDALTHLKNAVEMAPDSTGYHFWLAVAYANKVNATQDMMEKAQLAPLMKSSIEKAVELEPDNLDAREFLAQYLFNAPPMVGGDAARGMEEVEAIKVRDPKRGHLFAARLHMAKKERDEAETELKAALALDTDDPAVHYQLGIFYQGGEDWNGAYASFEKALDLDPNHMPSLYQMGRTGVFSGENLERAIECLVEYLETEPGRGEPTWAHAHWRMGMIYEKQGKVDMARAAYEKALEIDPENEQAKEALDALDLPEPE